MKKKKNVKSKNWKIKHNINNLIDKNTERINFKELKKLSKAKVLRVFSGIYASNRKLRDHLIKKHLENNFLINKLNMSEQHNRWLIKGSSNNVTFKNPNRWKNRK